MECLHKLMSTVSHMLDSIYSRRGTELLDAYLLHALKMKVAENLEPQRCSMVQARRASDSHPLQGLSMMLQVSGCMNWL